MDDPHDPRVPVNSLVLGYGPMLPLVLGGAGAWLLPPPLELFAVQAVVLWAALILVFIAGVRRGFGFGNRRASTTVEIVTMTAYFLLGLAALIVPGFPAELTLLLLGYTLVAWLDTRAAKTGNAPAHFARLRIPQMLIGMLGIGAALGRVLLA